MNWQGKSVFEEMDGVFGRGGGFEVSECGGFAGGLRRVVCIRYSADNLPLLRDCLVVRARVGGD